MEHKLTNKELQEAIIVEKEKGISDIEIGKKYGVNLRYIERVITKAKGVNVSVLRTSKKIKSLHPEDFHEEKTTVWSFKQRGNWATHSGEYRGNWSPYIPRNVILKYSKPGEIVLDYFCGAGTTAVEAKLLGRKCIALDINNKAIELAKTNVNFKITSQQLKLMDNELNLPIYEPQLSVDDARDLSFIQNNSMDLICAHPPYSNIIHYTDSKEGDLSFLGIDEFLNEMAKVAAESFRVLKPGRQCAILIGDMRKQKHVVPLGFKLIDVYLKAGFKLRELIIKRQHNCKTTGFWYANSIKYNFLLLAHEYLPIFEKPVPTTIVKEEAVSYKSITPKLIKPPLKKRLQELETTTVWIFSEKDFDERLNTNVIERYWTNDGYVTFDLFTGSGIHTQASRPKKKQRNSLVYIKALPENNDLFNYDVEEYLKEINAITEKESQNLNKGGVVAVLTQDIRKNGYLIPFSKYITDAININNLWLKEIVIVTKSVQANNLNSIDNEFLKINHHYLLVYEMKK